MQLEDALREATDALREVNRRSKLRKLFNYRPYGHTDTLFGPNNPLVRRWSNVPWQWDFHNAGSTVVERMLMAANRVGKCITYQTLIDTPDGVVTVGSLFKKGEPFQVWAHDGEPVKTWALPPFKKPGLHDCYRLVMQNGRWVECADDHRVFLDGSWRLVRHLLGSLTNLQGSNSECVRIVRGEDDRRLSRTLRGFRDDYLDDLRFGDGQLRWGLGNAQDVAPSPDDVRKRIVAWWRSDDLVRKYIRSPRPLFGRLSILDVVHRVVVRSFGFLGRAFYTRCQPSLAIPQGVCLPANAEVFELQSVQVNGLQGQGVSYEKIVARDVLLSINDIIGYYPIGRQEVYDFTVPEFHNYIAGGLVHHNTECAAAEIAFHATGEYPYWWEGKRFGSGTLIWTGSPTNETSRDIVQKAVLGGLGEEMGTGFLPKPLIVGKPKMRQAGVSDVVDIIKVRHVSGDISTVIFKTYEQGWRKWQGTAPHVVWLDEEPEDYKIYTECQTRILTSSGILMVTFTPLLGETELVQYFNNDRPKGTWLGTATWDDAPHLDEEAKKEQANRYPRHELKARTLGVPMMGSGGVFPISEEEIAETAFEIPSYFARIKGIDFGIYHPQATASIAWDRDRDIVYVYDVYRATDMDSFHHVAQLNSSDPWVPVAWPHDGLNRDKSGHVLIETYRRNGAQTLLTISARYDDEKGGSQAVEPIVLEILDRIQTGRFKVFSHLNAFFEEYRSYHRKDGKIVDRRDDILKAIMYAMMMLRYAMPALQPKRPPANARPVLSVSV